nr:aminotransferase class I/II-fold pyridoxal phosphate-dependent enzyme [Caldisalinibacter kiritimatiensis]
MKFETLLIHGGIDGDEHTGAVTVPIYQTSTYALPGIEKHGKYEYSRTGNPTREALEKLIAELEKGYKGFAFSSGMAAISSVLMLFNKGDHIIFNEDIYGGTFRVMKNVFSRFGIQYDFVNVNDKEILKNTLKKNTKAIYIETPTNPLMKTVDVSRIGDFVKSHRLYLIVDNTFMSPYLQRPIELGADIVIHSATKYLGGHSDIVAGLVVVNSEELANKIHFIQNSVGAILGPMDSWLVIKGIKTLALRMERHCDNAEKIYGWLKGQKWVKRVYYPGNYQNLKNKNQMKRYGGMISFEVESYEIVKKIISNLKVITLAESLGGVESLISIPYTMSHASMPDIEKERLGITKNLIRLSVGIEDVEDIIEDLEVD